MNKFISSLSILLVWAAVNASAQDKQFFNHLSAGVSLGVDGLGLEVAAPLSRNIQLRAGYSLFIPPYISKTVNFGTVQVANTRTLDVTHLPLRGGIWKDGIGKLMVDVYPSSRRPFHFVAGLFVGSSHWLYGKADFRHVIRPDEYATLSFSYHDITVSTDPEGFIIVDGHINPVMPYLGIGFGHAVYLQKRVNVTFDMGLVYTGGVSMRTYNYLRNDDGDPSFITSRSLDDRDKGIIDFLAGLPILPILKLNVFFNIL